MEQIKILHHLKLNKTNKGILISAIPVHLKKKARKYQLLEVDFSKGYKLRALM